MEGSSLQRDSREALVDDILDAIGERSGIDNRDDRLVAAYTGYHLRTSPDALKWAQSHVNNYIENGHLPLFLSWARNHYLT